MNPSSRPRAAMAAVLVVAVVGYNLLPGGSTGVGGPGPDGEPVGDPEPTPTARPPSPSRCPCGPCPTRCSTAGTYCQRPATRGLPMTITVPDGWRRLRPGFGVGRPRRHRPPHGCRHVFMQTDGAFDDLPLGRGGHRLDEPAAQGRRTDRRRPGRRHPRRTRRTRRPRRPTSRSVAYAASSSTSSLPRTSSFASATGATRTSRELLRTSRPRSSYAQGPTNRWHLASSTSTARASVVIRVRLREARLAETSRPTRSRSSTHPSSDAVAVGPVPGAGASPRGSRASPVRVRWLRTGP